MAAGLYEYPGAGRRAPQFIKRAVAQFRRLPLSARHSLPLLWWMLPEGTPPYKFSKLEAAYQDRPRGKQRCDNCRSAYKHVTSGNYICDQMSGLIEPKGWCRVWREPFKRGFYSRYQER